MTQFTPGSPFLSGFKPLKDGKIHFKCPRCGRKQSNMAREEYDPPTAVLAEILCPRCVDATFAHEPGTDYFDASGQPVDWA